MTASRIAKIRSAALYAFYVVAATILLIYVFFYRPFLDDLRTVRVPPTDALESNRLSPELLARVGWFRQHKESAFSRFPKKKKEAVVRLCAFGDSFTHGDEVSPDLDYPSLLNRHAETLRAAGGPSIEALNFGSSWWGFHQTHMLWEETSTNYACDVTLLGPMTFYAARDSSFGHTDLFSPYNLHSLYVLENDELRRVDVLGETYSERFDEYYAFFPARRSLRYDRRSPIVVDSLLPSGRHVENPFYYAPPWQETALRTYEALGRRMLDQAPEMRFLLALYEPMEDWASDLDDPRWTTFRPVWPIRFPYWAPRGHNSAWGNDFLARQMLARLFPETPPSFPRLRTFSLPDDVVVEALPRRSLSYWTSLQIELGGEGIGHFARVDRLVADVDASAMYDSGVVSLLGLQPADGSPLDAYWIEIDQDLRSIGEIYLLTGDEEIALGPLREPVPGLNLGVVVVRGLNSETERLLRGAVQTPDAQAPDALLPDLRVRLHDVVYEAQPARMFRAGRSGFRLPESLPRRGILEIVATRAVAGKKSEVVRRPFAAWRIEESTPPDLLRSP